MKAKFFALVMLCWPIWSLAAPALPSNSKNASTSSVQGGSSTLFFATTIGNKEPIRLQGHGASVRIPFSLPYGEDVGTLQVNLQGNVSRQMAGSVSLEAISDGKIIEQVALKPGTDLETQFAVPTQYLDPGFHTLTLQLTGVPGDSDENWVQIDPRASNFQYVTTPKSIAPRLDHLDWFFDRASLNYAPLVPLYGRLMADNVEPMAYAAQGISLRYQFLPTQISSRSIVPYLDGKTAALDALFHDLPEHSRTAVIVGPATEIAPILQALGIGKIDQATILVRQFPTHVHHYLLILTGEDEQQVLQAARSFANTALRYPPVSELSIGGGTDADEAAAHALSIRSAPFSQSSFPLAAAGFSTATLNGFSGPISMKIWNGGWQRDGELRLNLVYSAGMSATSDVNVLFNGALEGSIPLSSVAGGKYVKYAVSIPSTEAKAGWNTLTLVPNLIPASNHDFLFNTERANLQLSIFADSTFTWQGGDALRHLDLTALSSAGNLGLRAGQRVNLFIPQQLDAATMSATMTLVGKIAQNYGNVFPLVTSRGEDFRSGPILAVAPLRQLSHSIRADLGVEAAGTSHREWQFRRSLSDIAAQDPQGSNHYVFSLAKQTLAFTSRYEGHPLIVFSAVDAPTLQAGIGALIGFGLWPQLRGFTDWWQPDGKTVHAIQMQDEPFYAFGTSGGIGVWIGNHPWLAIVFFVLLAVLISVSIYGMVRRRYRSLPAESQVRAADVGKETRK